MFCLQCRRVESDVSKSAGFPLRSESGGIEPSTSARRCTRCGSTLLSQDTAEGVLRKLARLDSFGLTGVRSPLLERRVSRLKGQAPES